jgi:predicted transcriptional regulator of viral defense system
MNITEFIEQLISKGRYTFTSKEAQDALGVSTIAANSAWRRLRQKKKLVNPARGFHLILPPEYRVQGCMPPEYFIADLMQYFKLPYYVGLLSAAQFHGAAHQQPQQFQVVTNKARAAIRCGRAHIVFVKRTNAERMPYEVINTSYGSLHISTPEVTAMDLLAYPSHSVGINHVVTILAELAEKLLPEKIIELVKLDQELTWLQRLGFILDYLHEDSKAVAIKDYLSQQRTQPCALQTSISTQGAELNKEWNVYVNVELELDI